MHKICRSPARLLSSKFKQIQHIVFLLDILCCRIIYFRHLFCQVVYMKNLIAIIISLLCSGPASAQAAKAAPAAAYPPLDTVTYYLIQSESMTLEKGSAEYKVNDRVVSEQEWEKMTIGKEKIKACKPCVVKTYDMNDRPVCMAVQYMKCDVGFYIGYYPDGKVKERGSYKENKTGRWDKAALATYCGQKDGNWATYNEAGNIISSTLWKDGKPVKQEKIASPRF
jgi:hypothetical protein